jgi:hypothetical protein
VRDRDTGTATSVDSNGILTVSPSSGGILRLWVLAPGYTVYTYTNDDSGAGTNFIETEPLDPRVFGEWIVYKVVDSSTNEEYAVYDERVTFRPDGSVSGKAPASTETSDLARPVGSNGPRSVHRRGSTSSTSTLAS